MVIMVMKEIMCVCIILLLILHTLSNHSAAMVFNCVRIVTLDVFSGREEGDRSDHR